RCAKSEVKRYHQLFARDAGSILDAVFRIKPFGILEDWTRVGRGEQVPARIPFSIASGVSTSASDRNESVNVIRIPAPGDAETNLGWWLSWYEEWETVVGS